MNEVQFYYQCRTVCLHIVVYYFTDADFTENIS